MRAPLAGRGWKASWVWGGREKETAGWSRSKPRGLQQKQDAKEVLLRTLEYYNKLPDVTKAQQVIEGGDFR
jgi:hypothetical protein